MPQQKETNLKASSLSDGKLVLSTMVSSIMRPLNLEEEICEGSSDGEIQNRRAAHNALERAAVSKHAAKKVVENNEEWAKLKQSLKGNSHMMLKHNLTDILEQTVEGANKTLKSTKSDRPTASDTTAPSIQKRVQRWSVDMIKPDVLKSEELKTPVRRSSDLSKVAIAQAKKSHAAALTA